MKLEEAIEQLKSLQDDRKSFIEDETEHNSIFMQDYEAIDTVLNYIEHLQKENEELRKEIEWLKEDRHNSAEQYKVMLKEQQRYYEERMYEE